MKVIKESTVLARLEFIKTKADEAQDVSDQDKEYLKGIIDAIGNIISRLPAADEEDPNLQICLWHDLRKHPDDMPDDDISCLVHIEGYEIEPQAANIDGAWAFESQWGVQSILPPADGKVIAWTDMPVFQEDQS